MRRIVAYLATSLDGFIAGPDDDLSWLPELSPTETGYEAFFAQVGALLMGRRTFEVVRSFGDWPYEHVPTYVLSHTLAPGRAAPACVTRDPLDVLVRVLRGTDADEGIAWLVGGAGVFAAFAAADEIDEWIVTVVPVVLGAGTPLVTPGTPRLRLELIETLTLPAGCLQVRYRPAPPS